MTSGATESPDALLDPRCGPTRANIAAKRSLAHSANNFVSFPFAVDGGELSFSCPSPNLIACNAGPKGGPSRLVEPPLSPAPVTVLSFPITPADSVSSSSFMPSFAGLFARRKKSPLGSGLADTVPSELNSAVSSPTNEYVKPDRSTPSSPNGRSSFHNESPTANSFSPPSIVTPSNKFRLPFSRKKTAASPSTAAVSGLLGSEVLPQPAYLTRTSTGAASDGEAVDRRRLRPPPSKSAIFTAYADPHSALSTRSLPGETLPRSETPPPPPPPVPPKKRGFFPWTKSQPSSPQPTMRKPNDAAEVNDSSFNLKSFRHVGNDASNASDVSLTPPIPRPRGSSTASDSSQRISVAAFREAQARRSAAGSPIPSMRSPSPLSPYLTPESRGPPRPQQTHSALQVPARERNSKGRSIIASDSDELTSEEEDSDSDAPGRTRQTNGIRSPGNASKRAASQDRPQYGRATKSEAGHGSTFTSPSPRKDFVPQPRAQSTLMFDSSGTTLPSEQDKEFSTQRRSQSSLDFYNGGNRPRASASTSALTPSAAAKRASILASANANIGHTRDSSTQSNPGPSIHKKTLSLSSDTSNSDDDAPLATLVPPRRPGSAMSSASNANSARSSSGPSRPQTKPLININEVIQNGPRASHAARKSLDGFTPGATLISTSGLTSSPTQMSNPGLPIVSTLPPTKFVSPPSSPAHKPVPMQSSTRTMSSGPSSLVPVRHDTSPEQRRDGLSERLTKVVQKTVGSGQSVKSDSSTASGDGGGSRQTSLEPPELKVSTSPITMSSTTTTITAPKLVPPILRSSVSAPPQMPEKLSPPDEELVNVLGAGIKLISRTGESDSEEETEKSSVESDDTDEDRPPSPGRIAPIPIKERPPAPSFSVTSRPPIKRPTVDLAPLNRAEKPGLGLSSAMVTTAGARKRSSTLMTPISTPSVSTSSSSSTAQVSSAGRPMPVNKNLSRPGAPSGNSPSSFRHNVEAQGSAQSPPISIQQRQRSSTMLPSINSSASAYLAPLPKPFAVARRDSPASSTGDSSSGRAPFTPRDGSEVGSASGSGSGSASGGKSGDRDRERDRHGDRRGAGSAEAGVKPGGKHIKRRSVSFEEDLRDTKPSGKMNSKAKDNVDDEEQRRKERRRSEAKAAIELGNVINGRGTILDDDDDDRPVNQAIGARMSTLNPMMTVNSMGMPMGFGAPSLAPNWGTMNMNGWPAQQANPQLLSPAQFLPQPPANPALLAAHQQAMMFAKQAYQMAVAQQAMAAAGDEWERGSTVAGLSSAGSVYGGGGGAPSMMGAPFGMGMGMGMGGPMGMPAAAANGWSTGSVIFPGPSRSMYGGISSARSDYGGVSRGAGAGAWSSSKSSYGDLNPSASADRFSKASSRDQTRSGSAVQRESGFYPPVPPIPASNSAGQASKSSPRSRTTSQPASPHKAYRRAPPPSSWRANGL